MVHLEPARGDVLVRVPLNVYAEAGDHVFDTRLLGADVQVRVRPVGYRWRFGDGGSLTTSDAGAPYPDMQVTHTYTTPGEVRISVETGYAAEYAVKGGAWLPVEGTAWVAGEPAVRDVVAAEAVLVGE